MSNTKKLRVLVYGDIGGSGGYIRYCKGLFGSGATPKDHEITLVCSTSFYEQLMPLDAGIKVVHHSWPASPSRLHRYLWHLILFPKIICEYSPDVEFYPSGQLRLLFRRAKTVTACHNLLLFDPVELAHIDEKQRRQYEFYRDRQSKSFQGASGVIFSSQYSKDIVTKALPSIRSSCVVPLGVEQEFSTGNESSKTGGSSVNLLYVSPLFPYKHHQEVILAVKMLRKEIGQDLRLRLVGGGSLDAERKLNAFVIREEASGFIDRVGFVSNNELIEEYRKANIFIFASSCEAFGITLLEAMAASLPIACSERVGLPDILMDAGEYFNPDDSCSIADALRRLISDNEHRRKLGEKAFRYSQEYTWERSAQQTFEFIRQIAEQHTS